jgi:hypothetical protein
VLVNTSSLEGFPNTYLQAALSGVPVASLVVEQEFLNRTKAGICANGSLRIMADYVNDLWSGRATHDPAMARQYVIKHHGLTNSAQELAGLLKTVART